MHVTLLVEGVIFNNAQVAITPCPCSRRIRGRHQDAISLSFLGTTSNNGKRHWSRACPDYWLLLMPTEATVRECSKVIRRVWQKVTQALSLGEYGGPLEVMFTLEHRPRRPRGGVGVQLYYFFNLGARWGYVVRDTPRPLYPWETTGTHCVEGWVGPTAGLDGRGKFAPTGIRSPDRPARSETLFRLRYSGPLL